MDFEKDLKVTRTNIPGLLVFDLPVHGDSRGWFKENWQRAKMTALGLPDFGPVQNNISFNEKRGVTRGIHAERGTSTSASRPVRSSARGGSASGRELRSGVYDPVGPVEGDLCAAWCGQFVSGVGGRHRVHVSGERALEFGAEENLHVREPRGPGA